MTKKVTTMKLHVNLQCVKCYKKVKNVLCKFPHQKFDEKENTVTIKVVCCSPEKIMDQLCRKGCGAIKCIEKVPCKPPTRRRPTSPPPTPPPPPPPCCDSCCECWHDGPCFEPKPRVPDRTCCVPCHDCRPCRPCSERCCRPPPCYEGYFYAIPVYDSYGGGQPCYVSRCGQYVSEDNVTGCTIM
ncbi:protein PYRICULARIA ORYZAE RESISTANCE 21-like [Prosopis cineraria]|uniref:protein PYRICULARIA ORYZAE RESISTANCE 21-like n=1 Tax=Prosopis cineraria TaxID=364024 RepID=UPI00240EFF2E|nr:protein PYRICULARIA ORYZAE RESISTANCE 21-like [Prosopis cineraria]